jgi:hypothetical protein
MAEDTTDECEASAICNPALAFRDQVHLAHELAGDSDAVLFRGHFRNRAKVNRSGGAHDCIE